MENYPIPLVSQAVGFEKYTASEDVLPYNFCTMYLTADCTLSVTDHFDHEEDDVPFSAGYHPVMFKKIRAISTGSVYLCHNGQSKMTLSEIVDTVNA